MLTDILGWSSTAVLLFTIGSQIYRQWKAENVKGVSPWLFIGQALASIGLLAYSILQKMWVCVVLNGAMLIASAAGLAIWWHFSTRKDREQLSPTKG